jgi:hypothetical protein
MLHRLSDADPHTRVYQRLLICFAIVFFTDPQDWIENRGLTLATGRTRLGGEKFRGRNRCLLVSVMPSRGPSCGKS